MGVKAIVSKIYKHNAIKINVSLYFLCMANVMFTYTDCRSYDEQHELIFSLNFHSLSHQ